MPISLPGVGVLRTPANFDAVIEAFVNGLETTLSSLSATVSAQGTTLAQKYTMPASGLPLSLLPPGSKFSRFYVDGAWQPRGTTRTDLSCEWVKTDPAQPNPPFTAGYAIAGPDTLLAATA